MTSEQIKAKLYDLSKEQEKLANEINSSPQMVRVNEIGKEMKTLEMSLSISNTPTTEGTQSV